MHKPLSAANLSSWRINGAIAAKNQRKSWSAMLVWQQLSANHYSMRLYGPLGGGTVWIEQQGQHITYRDGQKVSQSNNPEQLIYHETGIKIPVSHLPYWLRGIPAPHAAHAVQHDAQGQLLVLQQAGFRLQFSTYSAVNGILLPTKIEIIHPEGTVKIVIKQWTIP